MYRKTFLLIFVLSAFTFFLRAQSFTKGVIRGQVTDGNKIPVQHANILLKNGVDSLYVNGLTNKNGSFNFFEIAEGSYGIEVSATGFASIKIPNLVISKTDSIIDLDPIKLVESSQTLQEVTIKAQHPFLEKQIDKTVINVDQSIINNGTTALELMQKLPRVQITTDGQITLNGKSGVNVLIDGKPTYLSAGDLVNLLGGTSSSDIHKIEIMTNPSAKYDAGGTGGIINILKKKSHKKGFNGNISGSLGQAYYGRYNGGVALNYKNDHFNVFLNNSYNANKTVNHRIVTTDILNGNNLMTEQSSDNTDIVTNKANNTTLGIDLYLTKKTILTFINNFSDRYAGDETNSTMNILDSHYTRTNSELFKASNIDKAYNYSTGLQLEYRPDTLGKELNFNADYSNYVYRPKQNNTTILSDASNNFLGQSDALLDEYRHLLIYGIRADYVQPLKGNGKLEAGLKSSFVKTINNSSFFNQVGGQSIADSTQSDYSINTENINAAYINLNKSYSKLTVQTGLRAEQTVTKGKQVLTRQSVAQNYFQLFPTLFLDYKFNRNNNFNFQFGRRTDRADYHELIPFRRPLTPTLYFEGNPNLKPQLSWHTEATWTYQSAFFITFSYDIYRDYIRTLPFLDSNKITTTRNPINIQGAHSWNISVGFNKQLTSWWSTNNTVSLYQTSFSGQINSFSLHYRGRPSLELELNESLTINKVLSARSILNTILKRQFVGSTYGAYSILNFGIMSQLFHKKGSISLNARNVLRGDGRNGTDRYENLNQHSHSYSSYRTVILTFTYRFGTGKLTKTQKKSGSAEEQQRAGN